MTAATATQSIPDLLDHWCAGESERPLFTFSEPRTGMSQAFSYGTFAARSRSLARAFRDAGLGWGDRAILTHPPGLELVAALVACMRIGVLPSVAPVTAGAGLNGLKLRSRIAAIVSDCAPALALGVSSQQQDWSFSGLGLLATDAIPSQEPGAAGDVRPAPHPIALLQYTSGSTSQPRGVAITHQNIIANARALIDHMPIGATWLPQFHDMGLIGHYLFPIVLGGRCHGMAASEFMKRPESWLRLMSEHSATYAAAPPLAFELLLRRHDKAVSAFDGVDLTSLRVLMAGAEPVTPDLMRTFEQRFQHYGLGAGVLVTGYGLAEATLAVTRGTGRSCGFDATALHNGVARPAKDGKAVELCSAGSPLENLRVTVCSAETGAEQPEGVVGEIRVQGPSVAPFYWHERHVELPREVLSTRDLGFLHEGELFVCGRSSEVIICHGEKFHPHDIERAATAALEAMRNCLAFADAEGRSTLLIEGVPRAPRRDAGVLASAVAAATGLQLDRVIWAGSQSISRTTSGKVARHETCRRLAAGELRILCDILLNEIDADDEDSALDWLRSRVADGAGLASMSLSDIGVDSLRLVRLQLELEQLAERCGLRDEIADMDGPTLLSSTGRDLLAVATSMARQDRDQAISYLQAMTTLRQHARASEQEQMAADARSPLFRPAISAGEQSEPQAILLTGATGFLGPHLLSALLDTTDLPIFVIARGNDEDDAGVRVARALSSVAPAQVQMIGRRVTVYRGDLEPPDLGLTKAMLRQLQARRLAIYHNGALVDYVQNYHALRATNVLGTRTLLELAMGRAGNRFHHISSTFIFGWTRKPVLAESDGNVTMSALDFGYAQSKWVAEQLVTQARSEGLLCTIFRPSLISVSGDLRGDRNDVAARLLAFMIRHRIAVDTPNQLSLVPVDAVAHNIAALSVGPEASGATYHVTADHYYSLTDLTRRIGEDFGFRFRELSISAFIAELNRLAGPSDPVFPLLDFFNRSAPHIAEMTLKRYDNARYRAARDSVAHSIADPGLGVVASRLVGFLDAQGWLPAPQPDVRLTNEMSRN